MAPPKRQRRTQALDNLGPPASGYVLTGDPDDPDGLTWTAPDISVVMSGTGLTPKSGATLPGITDAVSSFDPDANEAGTCVLSIPGVWQTFNLWIGQIHYAGGTGNVRWKVTYYTTTGVETVLTLDVGPQYVPSAHLVGSGIVPPVISGLATAKAIRVDVERDAEHADDTYASDVGLFSVMAEFAS